jgi:hypothetical protein
MIIQCNIKRDGLTRIRIDGIVYTFEPDSEGRNVCRVTNDAHIKYFSRHPENFEQVMEDEEDENLLDDVSTEGDDREEQQGINFNNGALPQGKHNPLGTVKQRDRDREITSIKNTIASLEKTLDVAEGEKKKVVESRLEEMKGRLTFFKKPRTRHQSGKFTKKTRRVREHAAA